ncbi:MAG: hypothetical protein ACTS3F_13665 [Phycisphaerales bacterium]
MPSGKPRKPNRCSPATRSVRPAKPARPRRACAQCTACCSAMAVPAIDKPQFTPCSRLSTDDAATGCADYRNRPAACREFRCAWLDAFPLTANADRPDKLGLILIRTIDPQAMQVREVWKGAGATERAQEFITTLRRAGIRVEFVTPTEQKTLQPLTMFGRPVLHVRPAVRPNSQHPRRPHP